MRALGNYYSCYLISEMWCSLRSAQYRPRGLVVMPLSCVDSLERGCFDIYTQLQNATLFLLNSTSTCCTPARLRNFGTAFGFHHCCSNSKVRPFSLLFPCRLQGEICMISPACMPHAIIVECMRIAEVCLLEHGTLFIVFPSISCTRGKQHST